ncbi:alpha-2,8-polysialyltransferase family protein [Streptomyces scopuliridis]|uniref:Alpha-2,8-polysialyltransferase family protein n=1 Tax=Streptomyces scopuliridis TaxID=452529 RepID=A0ACD4ZLY4_9ACTN|nr:alpha-2,8-polysialyltransferase family protein [Streptomyces scopuliridis]WSB33851.1 alpha-2,8-polysialyltransferase family protein [Streptomyces scopuliridis]WSB98131.1 alpha-2,8-polysialyltransferase family protein [Streptomyces scopuliridis]WSC08167.1 alpha-2,8-polysialyltransferase family protein [Streptomyces scopuliridis]
MAPSSVTSASGAGRTTQVFCASTLYGAATLAAAIDAGLFPAAGRRLLVVCNNAGSPELTPSVDEMPGFEQLRDRFDDLVSWNETIAPFHPGSWSPRSDDVPLWERHLRLAWRLGDDDVRLIVESIQVNPALAIAQIFTGAPIEVYADGLMSYGPTRSKIEPLVGERVRRLLHLDLVPGLKPLLLTEFGVAPELVPTDAFLRVLDELTDAERNFDTPSEPPALLLGQYLSALGILTEREEEELHIRMVRGAVAKGHTQVVFKPHPTAPAAWSRRLEQEAKKLGADLTILDSPVLAEVLYRRLKPALVVGCFSTALFTASAFYGIPVAHTGTELLLERLAPYQNSNRVPVTIVDALLPSLDDSDEGDADAHRPEPRIAELVATVGYAMQHQIYPGLRPTAEKFLSEHLDAHTWRYFKRRRLTALALPGAVPAQLARIPRNATARRMVRRARKLRRAVLR